MRRTMIALGVLLALWTAGELVAPGFVEAQIEERASANTRGVTGVEADVRSFPMVTRLVLTGRVERIEVSFREVVRERLTFTDVVFSLEGIQVDRAALTNRDAEIRSIARGEVSAELPYGPLTELFGAAQQLGLADFTSDVTDRTLRLMRDEDVVFDAALPDELFPCSPDAELEEDAVRLRCTFTDVPEWMIRAANRTG